MIKSKNYLFNRMSSVVKNLIKSFKTDKWTFSLHKASVNATQFKDSYILVAVYEELPDTKFIVSPDAQYYYMDSDLFFDVLEDDVFIGEYPVKVFSESQKENIYRELCSKFSVDAIITDLCNENDIETNPFKNSYQKDIADVFNMTNQESCVTAFIKRG